MINTNSRPYEAMNSLERDIARLLRRTSGKLALSRILSPWMFFWLIVGGFFFTFQTYLWIAPIAGPATEHIELTALGIGIFVATLIGLGVNLLWPPGETDWRVPSYVFALWMIAPTIFPILFLVGIFLQNDFMLNIQTSAWRAGIEYSLFGLGIMVVVLNYRKIAFTQGAITIMLLSLFFITKALISDGFYLAGKCPTSVLNEQMAWLSNSVEEVQLYRQHSKAVKFYQSPLGQFVCTHTQEDLFR